MALEESLGVTWAELCELPLKGVVPPKGIASDLEVLNSLTAINLLSTRKILALHRFVLLLFRVSLVTGILNCHSESNPLLT